MVFPHSAGDGDAKYWNWTMDRMKTGCYSGGMTSLPRHCAPAVFRLLLPAALLLALPLRAADILSDTAVFGFPDFLTYRNATSRGWNFGNTAANAPTVMLLGVTMKGNTGVADPSSGLSFTTAPLTYAISGFAWTGAPEQTARDALSKGGLHGGSGFFAMKLSATPGTACVLDILALDASAPAGRSMDVIVDGVTVKDDWRITVGNPYNRVIRIRTVADADGIDLRMGRGGIAGTDVNPAISAVALTEELASLPVIGTHPCGVTQTIGGRAEFSVVAGGTVPMTYQWRRNTTTNVGTNSPALIIDPVAAGDAGTYDVVITNSLGSATSSAAPLQTVTPLTPGGTGILQDLAGYWRFDETRGCTAPDTSGLHNSGRLLNFPAGTNAHWTTGKVGGALRFDGPVSGQHVIVNNFPRTTTAYTLAAWVFADTIPVWASIAKNWFGEFHFGLDATGNSLSNYVGLSPSGQQFAREPGTFPTGSWQHVACTVDAANIRLYRNGTQVASTAYSGTWFTPQPAPMGIGVKLNGAIADTGAPGYWDGLIDDLALWNRALSAAEVFNLYAAGAAGQDITQASAPAQPASLVINEFLADNTGGLEDEDRDSPDWIELYNGTATAVNLAGYHLSDNPANLTKWTFPAVTMGAGQFLVVFASNKDRRVPGQPLHTNFGLDAGGEDLTLTAPDGVARVHRYGSPFAYAADNPARWYPSEAKVSMGLANGEAVSRYFPVPTPGQPNVAPVPAAGAIISGVTHEPAAVSAGQPIMVSAMVQADQPDPGDGNRVSAVNLTYRVMFGAETTLPMTAGAGGLWSATIPAGATAGQMVRWAVTATTTHGDTSRSPRNLLPNSPQYHGTVITDAAITTRPSINTGNGMKNMSARLRDFRGSFRIESEPSVGTSVHLSVPIRISS